MKSLSQKITFYSFSFTLFIIFLIVLFIIIILIVFTRIIIIVTTEARVFGSVPVVTPAIAPSAGPISSSVVIIVTIIIATICLLLSAKFMSFGRHGHGLGLHSFVTAFGAGNGRVLLVLDPLPPDVILTEADLAPETRVLAVTVTGQALEVLRLHHLTACLVLELVILAQELEAEATGECST